MGVKIFNGQGFHPGEQVVPQPPHGALAHIDHDPVVGKRRDHAHRHDAGQADDLGRQTAEITAAAFQHRGDVVIHKRLREGGSDDRRRRRNDDADDDKEKRDFIIMKHVPDHAADHFRRRRPGCLFLFILLIHRSVSLLSKTLTPAGRSRRFPLTGMCRSPDRWHWSSTDFRGCQMH